VEEFFVQTTGRTPTLAPPPTLPAPGPKLRPVGRWLVAGAALLAALVAVALWAIWPTGGPARVDLQTARLFGQQTGLQLPAPVTRDECAGAVKAFSGIAAQPAARAAFINACVTAH
jgi:hypothetical protein